MKKEDQNKPEASFMYWGGLAKTLEDENPKASRLCTYIGDFIQLASSGLMVGPGHALRQLYKECDVDLLDIITICKFGAEKYGLNNYATTGSDIKRYVDAIGRHIIKHIKGEWGDEDTGASHLTHIAANCLILFELFYNEQYTNTLTKYKDGWWTG